MTNKEQVLIEIQSKFRQHIKSEGLVYMSLYDLIKDGRPITSKTISEAVYMFPEWAESYRYIWEKYI